MSSEAGFTESERYLARLCNKTFLSLWSYPNVFRDQGKQGKGDGKEIVDLLAIFGNDILLFSDKHIQFGESGNLATDWRRWHRAAIEEGSKQLFGAERWFREHPERIFTDQACTVSLPITLPPVEQMRFHRIVVVRGAAQRCRKELGGSGSLMISSADSKDTHIGPFMVGQPWPKKGFVHVIDETALDILLNHLDTVADLTAYLRCKESLFTGKATVLAAGEEELLGIYLGRVDENTDHGFFFDDSDRAIAIEEGYWSDFVRSPERTSQRKANEISYSWDRLIEKFSFHIVTGTQHFATDRTVPIQETLIRWLARENRTRRRMISRKLGSMIMEAKQNHRRATLMMPSRPGDPFWVFLVLGQPPGVDREDYRWTRRELLTRYCAVVRYLHPNAEDICGIATDIYSEEGISEDAVYFDGREWSDEMQVDAREWHEEFGLLNNTKSTHFTEREYPAPPPQVQSGGKTGRNEPCPCGSGIKFKKCCLRATGIQ